MDLRRWSVSLTRYFAKHIDFFLWTFRKSQHISKEKLKNIAHDGVLLLVYMAMRLERLQVYHYVFNKEHATHRPQEIKPFRRHWFSKARIHLALHIMGYESNPVGFIPPYCSCSSTKIHKNLSMFFSGSDHEVSDDEEDVAGKTHNYKGIFR